MNIIKKSISEQIYNVLKMEILSQKIKFGEKLINKDLQEKFGVSSTPIRDAINRLYQDGLIEEITNSGARVLYFNLKFAMDVNEMMLILAKSSLALSGKRANIEKVASELDEIILQHSKNIATDEYFDWDYKFHKVFFDYMENNECKRVYKKYNVLHELFARYYNVSEDLRSHSYSQHKLILNAYRIGRIDEAIELMETHYKDVSEMFKKNLK